MKQNIPKLCRGRIVCQIGLSASFSVQTGISVNKKSKSKTNKMIRETKIYILFDLQSLSSIHPFSVAIQNSKRILLQNCSQIV
jgi:hypothetical protein